MTNTQASGIGQSAYAGCKLGTHLNSSGIGSAPHEGPLYETRHKVLVLPHASEQHKLKFVHTAGNRGGQIVQQTKMPSGRLP